MIREAPHLPVWNISKPAGGAAPDAAASASDEATLDQFLAEPIVQQLMRRDQTDEATIRDLRQEVAIARQAMRANDSQCDGSANNIAGVLEQTSTRKDRIR
jgi:hypothetical protein